MKKFISLVLALVMLLTIGTVAVSAFAEENNRQLKTGESVEISFDADEEIIYTFIPKRSGNYKIIVTGGTEAAVEIEIYGQANPDKLLDEGCVMSTDEKSFWGVINLVKIMTQLDSKEEEFMYMNAKANRAIEIKLTDMTSQLIEEFKDFRGLSDCFLPSTVTVTVEAAELEPIRPGHRPHVSRKNVFEFVPDRTGEYRFTSASVDGAMPSLTICDYTGCIATSEAFTTSSGVTDNNFDVTAELQAGETYLVHCENDAVNDENEAVGSFSVELEDLTAEADVTKVTYLQQEDTHKDFTVTANGRKSMIQFIEPDGGTRTYDRYHKNVSITSYNADGEAVSAMSRDLAYEVWNIYSNMSVGNEIKVRGKENGEWDKINYTFTIEEYNPVISMELASASGKKGPVPATVAADEKTEKVMFKMPNGTSVTVSTYTTDENGNRVFKGNAWMNEDGLNEIQVLIRRNNIWQTVGILEYSVA